MTTPAAPKPDDTTLAELLKRVVTLEADFVALGTVVTTITNAYALGRATTTGAFEIAAAERHDLEARVTALEDKTAPPPEPDEYQAYTAEREHRRVMESP